jgi:hypothetical protein
LTVVLAWVFSDRSLNQSKSDLLAQQRAAVQAVGSEWVPLRDRIERITLDAAAGAFKGDEIDPEAAKWDFRSVPGLYLRLRIADAKNAETIRKQSRDSVKDAFTGCLLREPNAALARGDADAGSAPDQPWNLRQAYASTRVLSDEWAREVKEADDKLRLRVFEQQYEKAQRVEIPLAIEIVKRAQFYLLVLDEDVPEAKDFADADGGAITEEALQQVPHPARVHIVNLKTGAVLARLRRTASAEFHIAQGSVRDPEFQAALRRQVNNCALAQEVWASIHPPPATAAKP